MKTDANNFPRLLLWMVGISIILFCAAGIAALMGWIPTSLGGPAEHLAASAKSSAKAPLVQKNPAVTGGKLGIRERCADCGVIESVRVVDRPGDTTALGVVGGALVGGLLGSQVGAGRGKDLATVAGAVGGAVAGNEIEKQARSSKRYETTVRFANGSTRVFSETSPSQLRPGERVRVIDGVMRPQG